MRRRCSARKRPGLAYELIAIPLVRFSNIGWLAQTDPSQCLGILTMQNAINPGGPDSLFTTRQLSLLNQVQCDMTAFLAASLAHEDALGPERDGAPHSRA